MKPDPYRLQLENYPFSIEIATRFGDLDSLGHINNVSFARLFEEARVRFNLRIREQAGVREMHQQGRFVLAANDFAYLHEAHYPDPVTIGVGVLRVGKTSYALGCAMFQKGVCVATNDSTIVCASDKSTYPVPEIVRARLEKNLIAHPRAASL